MITVTLKAHHWRIARRDLITLHCNNLVSSIILSLSLSLSLSLETRRSPEINSQNHKHSDPAQTQHRERQRELWSAAAAKPKKTERERELGKMRGRVVTVEEVPILFVIGVRFVFLFFFWFKGVRFVFFLRFVENSILNVSFSFLFSRLSLTPRDRELCPNVLCTLCFL